jgi:hypothetical protein
VNRLRRFTYSPPIIDRLEMVKSAAGYEWATVS